MRQPIQVEIRDSDHAVRVEQVSAPQSLIDKLDKAGKAFGWIVALFVALCSLCMTIYVQWTSSDFQSRTESYRAVRALVEDEGKPLRNSTIPQQN